MSSVSESSTRLFWLIVLSAIFSPLAVVIEFGFDWKLFWNFLLFLLIPAGGFIHAIYVLCHARYSKADKNGYAPILDQETSVQPSNYGSNETRNVEIVVADRNTSPPPYNPAIENGNIEHDNKVQRNI